MRVGVGVGVGVAVAVAVGVAVAVAVGVGQPSVTDRTGVRGGPSPLPMSTTRAHSVHLKRGRGECLGLRVSIAALTVGSGLGAG
jgi:hypothetical protein